MERKARIAKAGIASTINGFGFEPPQKMFGP